MTRIPDPPSPRLRRTDWPMLLNRYVLDAQARYQTSGLQWGAFDCCIFAFDWVKIATGDDPMADYRGRYSSREEALQILRDNGAGTLRKACTKYFGEPVPASLAQRGDVAYLKSEKACGIFVTQGARMKALFLGEGGLMQIPALHVDLAFRV